MKIISRLLTLLLIFACIHVFPQKFPEPLQPPRLVNDFVNFLNPQERNALEQKLSGFEQQTSTQISIVTIKSTEGYDIGDYAVRLAEKWGIGQKGKNNGILILVKPKSKGEKGEINISPGYGLEGVVPDAIAKRIIEQEIIPDFKVGENYKGLDKATGTLMSLTKGEFSAEQYLSKSRKANNYAPIILTFIFFAIVIIMSVVRAKKQASHFTSADKGATKSSLPLWLMLMMMGSMNSRGKFGDFSSGGGNFGGGFSGGGGFGGFGGGSFGGGGASGSW